MSTKILDSKSSDHQIFFQKNPRLDLEPEAGDDGHQQQPPPPQQQQQQCGVVQPGGSADRDGQPGTVQPGTVQPRVQFLKPRRADGVTTGEFRRQQRDRPEAAPRNQPAADGSPSPNDELEARLEDFRQSEREIATQCHVSPLYFEY